MTRNRDIPMAKSLVDYIFRWLGMEFIPGYRAANAPRRAEPLPHGQAIEVAGLSAEETDSPGNISGHGPRHGNGNGNSGRAVAPDTKLVRSPVDEVQEEAMARSGPVGATSVPAELGAEAGAVRVRAHPTLNRMAALDPLSLQGASAQADAPACDVCGSITVRSGTCYKCLNCGNSMGCS
jgi:ribonucleoside-diphosphate reductase alpha chain